MAEPLYPYNTRQWVKDDIVLHMYDAKHPKMFMKVIGYTRDGFCMTQYVHPDRSRRIWNNPISHLLNPADFGMTGGEDADAFERVRLWNYYHPIGTTVETFGDNVITLTATKAWLAGGNVPMIELVNKPGAYLLRFVRALKAEVNQTA